MAQKITKNYNFKLAFNPDYICAVRKLRPKLIRQIDPRPTPSWPTASTSPSSATSCRSAARTDCEPPFYFYFYLWKVEQEPMLWYLKYFCWKCGEKWHFNKNTANSCKILIVTLTPGWGANPVSFDFCLFFASLCFYATAAFPDCSFKTISGTFTFLSTAYIPTITINA
jgi:hypothetical protein